MHTVPQSHTAYAVYTSHVENSAQCSEKSIHIYIKVIWYIICTHTYEIYDIADDSMLYDSYALLT